ncbi:uncharacterized protein [Nicotiana sylvestris]|uniref:uncharacterized protein n=1 Tax=Nicotiana sylvestris TaxID=4096 RepID=UPI00388CE441
MSDDHIPTGSGSIGVDRAGLANAFIKLKSELLRREAKFSKAVDGDKSLKLLYDKREDELAHLRYELQKKTEGLEFLRGEVGQAKHERDELKARVDTRISTRKDDLSKASPLEVQLRNAHENSLVRMDMIPRLEFELLKMKAEVADAWAEAEVLCSFRRGTAVVDPEGSRLGAFQKCGLPLGEIDDLKDFLSCFLVSSGELWEAHGMIGATAGIPHKGGGSIANIFDGVIDRADLDIPSAVKVAEKFMQQCKKMYDHAILRLRGELSYHEKECKKVTSKLEDLEARSAWGGKELGQLRATLETALRKKANLVAQINQLNAEIFGLRERNEIVVGELATSQGLLEASRKEISSLAMAKSEVEQNAITYQEDAATTHRIARDMSIAAERKLTRAIKHAKAGARRETLEKIGARGIDLSADLMEAREVEEKLTLSSTPDKGENNSDEE